MALNRRSRHSLHRAGDPPAFVSNEVPLYYQLASVLRERIVSGQLAPGDRLPTEAQLVADYGVSRITVRQALRNLTDEGLIRALAGRGTFVTDRAASRGTLQMEGSLDDLMSLGLATEVKVIDLVTLRATAEQAKVLSIDVGSTIMRCTRLRYYEGVPYSHVVNELPVRIARRFSQADWSGSILRVLEERCGIPVRDAYQTIRASLADASLARLLETRIGAPLIAVDRVVLTDNAVPIERVHTHYRSDIYSMSVHLSRATHHDSWALKVRRASQKDQARRIASSEGQP